MKKRIIAYCRVSTNDGRQTTENQSLAINKYLSCHDDLNLVKIFEDNASGAKHDRQGLNAMIKYCSTNKVDAVIVFKLDRLGRSTQHLLQVLAFFQSREIDFISVTEAIDTQTAAGKMLCTFLAAISEFERALITERVYAGLERAKHNGIKLGRPRKGFDIGTAIKLRDDGKSYKEIARELHVPVTTVFRYLKSIPKTPMEIAT